MPKSATSADTALRRVVRLVALLNFAYFGVEFAVARMIGSVSLFADSIDFLEDASVNFLILAATWMERGAPSACRHGACWHSAGSRTGDPMDGVGQVQRPGAARSTAASSLAGAGALASQLVLRLHAGSVSGAPGAVSRGRHSYRRATTPSPISPLSERGLVTAYLWPSAWPRI